MDIPAAYLHLFTAASFVLGLVVGSFLNVCIYRLPLGLAVNQPARSFCPSCKYQIPWYQNLPLVSWLLLRGRCANCGSRIAFRYFGIELLTGLLFTWVWLWFPWNLALAYWIFVSLLVVATFIDFEHFIIPDEITWGGTAAGIVCAAAFPALMGQTSRWVGMGWSVVGGLSGFATLWLVVELGKKAFGKKRVRLEKAVPFVWTRTGDDAELKVDDEVSQWSEIFSRKSDQLVLNASGLEIDGQPAEAGELRFHYDRLLISGKEIDLDTLDSIRGTVSEVTIPREAMGFGDVKFIAAIGAFLGWKAVFFTIMSASVVGAVVGVGAILIGRRQWSARLPFGPYLSLGALLWMLAGPELVGWYLGLMAPAAPAVVGW